MTTDVRRRPRQDAYVLGGRRATAPCGHAAPCGCEHAPCCFECPLPRCKFDPGGTQAIRMARLTATIKELRHLGFTRAKIAETLGITQRSVSRHLNGG